MRLRFIACLGFVTAVVGLSGCGRDQPAESRVEAKNFSQFYYWRSSVSSQFTADAWREFNDAIEELRLKAMAGGATGTGAIDQALCDRINGHTIPEVLRLADEAKLSRLIPLRDRLKLMVDGNALLATRYDDDASATDLARRREEQESRLKALIDEIEVTRKHLLAHGGTATSAWAVDPKPAVLTRSEALAEFARMVTDRRDLAVRRYGGGSTRIDRSGALLPADDRAAFDEKSAAAKANGHAVIPVLLNGRWWIFDGVANLPEFSEAVMANLTDDDRRALTRAWANSEAEIWARHEASKEDPAAARERLADQMRAGAESAMRDTAAEIGKLKPQIDLPKPTPPAPLVVPPAPR